MQSLTISPETAAHAADGSGASAPDFDTLAAAAQSVTAPVQPRSFTFEMPLFRPGVQVQESGRNETVSHVVLRRREMVVYLVGREEPVRPERLRLQPSKFTTARRAEGLNWFL
ncbi:MAG: hypothetical protein RR311_09150 [Comamonas sp.]|uniref:hypothetical protein n=1 Tax=Acidovorax sp. CCYZU-2555 TaxID=2835042 RepID=UPI0020BF9821|nr:hypothetical protein [Acidovorax sp. CCYZU-2555]